MKANELMLGDWVMDGDMPTRVTSITRVGIVETMRRISNIEVVEPIPITPEILEKNGFEKTHCGLNAIIYTFSDDDEYYALAIDEYTESIWRVEYTNCEMNFPLVRIMVCSVHELQHALKLCGIEKEIVI